MKTNLPETMQAPGGPTRSDRRGVALITVLTFVALTTILMMTFFLMAQNEHMASVNYSEGLQAQEVAESAVNIVIAQIRQATANADHLWASQPGAIRVWNADGRDKFDAGYKLYSDDQMVVKGSTEKDFAERDFNELANWTAEPASFVDLNEPVIRGDKVYYPIVDPLAASFPKWPPLVGGGARKGDTDGVEGFDYDRDHSRVKLSEFDKVVTQKSNKFVGANYDALPMPVRWIYQLKDGSLGYLVTTNASSGKGTFKLLTSGSPGPSTGNPIVARFAFWADDETCKLNPNYHAGGATWNTPMAGGDIDRNDGGKQPIKGEYQRYTGHPATTHLSPVIIPGIVNITNDRQAIEKLFEMIPRIVGGGSEFGTKAYNVAVTGAVSINTDRDRLYASVDEMLFQDVFKNERVLNEFPTAGGRIGTVGARSADEILDQLERMRFFLTVNSRAPEVNLLNRPRISMWPTYNYSSQAELAYMTSFDRLIRFCGQMGVGSDGLPNKYYFERKNEDDQLYDYKEIPRNRQLYEYMDWLTDQKLPGYGKAFSDTGKFGTDDRYQLLTEIFDYIRATNLYDDSLFFNGTAQQYISDPKKSKQTVTYTNGRSKADNGLWPGFGQVTPIRINYKNVETQGFGRFHCLQEIGTMTICCADGTGGDSRPGGMYPDIQDPGVYEWDTTNIIKPSAPANENTAEYSNYPPLHQDIVPSPKDSDIVVANPAATQTNFMPRTNSGALFNDTIFPKWPSWLIRLYWRYGTVAGKAAPNSVPVLPIADDNFVRETAIAPGDPGYKNELILVPAEVMRAFETKRWNWNLAWLDPKYASVLTTALQDGGGGVTRYDRKNLSGPGGFQPVADRGSMPAGDKSRLLDKEKLVQSALLFQLAGNSLGYNPINSDFTVQIRSLKSPLSFVDAFKNNVEFSSDSSGTVKLDGGVLGQWYSQGRQTAHSDHALGGTKNVNYMLIGDDGGKFFPYSADSGGNGASASGRRTPLDLSYKGAKNYNQYPFVTRPYLISLDVPDPNTQLHMNYGSLQVSIYSAGEDTKNKNSDPKVQNQQLVQEVEIELGEFYARAPDLAAPDVGYWLNSAGPGGGTGRLNAMTYWSMGYEGANPISAPYGRIGVLASRHNLDLLGKDRDARVDVLRGVGIRHGDSRIVMTRPKITKADGIFVEHIDYQKPAARIAMFNYGSNAEERRVNKFSNTNNLMYLDEAKNVQLYGDFDNGLGQQPDGPWINKPDEGNLWFVAGGTGGIYGNIPYFSEDWNQQAVTPSYFTPNRIVCSPVAFGSLPRRAKSGKPWETLLFRPNVTGGLFTTHPGAEDPPDHLLLDMFWMPVVEPFAISEPLSTGGKVNLNQDMLPFRHITRDTALLGVFKSEYMVVIPDLWKGNYKTNHGYGKGWHWKNNPYGGEMVGVSLRAVIEPTGTLDQFHEKFKSGKIFKTASEICDIHLVPISIGATQQSGRDNGITTPHWKQMGNGTYWSINRMTGDNAKEKPYNNIYPRITTKSNTFKVHYRAQILTKAKVTAPDAFDPEIDQVVAEYRGSSIVERYVEPNDPDIPDYASASSTSGSSGSTAASLDKFYKFRVVNPTRFAP